MRLHVLVQGMDESRRIFNSCENLDFGFLELDDVIDLIRSIPPPPPGYEEWDCGVTVTIESGVGKAYVSITMNGMDDYTVLKYDEGTGEEVLVGSSITLSDVIEALNAFYSSPTGEGLAPGRVRVEEYGINYQAECGDIVSYDRSGHPVIQWRECNLNITNKAVAGVPISKLRIIRLLDPNPMRPYPELVLEYGEYPNHKIMLFRFRDMSTYQRVLSDLPKFVPPHLINRST
jgi:hypothetical protein